MIDIKTVTVIGANGTMGANISAIFASFGNAKVYMVSRSVEKSQLAVTRACSSVRADAIAGKLIPCDYSMLPQCIPQSDLIFECVTEKLDVKLEVVAHIRPYIREDTYICFGTSGLPVTTLAEAYPESVRASCFGVHLFNPPYSMTLCEFIPTKYSDAGKMSALRAYLTDILFRTVVVVKDSPAFLGNRIGFQFINEAMQYAEKYKDSGGIDYIDSILGPFTGRSMPPITTADFVGLDIHKAIVDNLYNNTNDYAHDTFVLPQYAQKLIHEGKLGRKSHGGMYKRISYDNGLKRMTVYDISSGVYRDKMPYSFPFAESMIADFRIGNYDAAFRTLIHNHSAEAIICLDFLLKYVIYSLSAAEMVGYDLHAADAVMATGFNWCPPLAVIDALSAVTDFGKLIYERLGDSVAKQVDTEKLLSKAEPSDFDYRIYFKSAR